MQKIYSETEVSRIKFDWELDISKYLLFGPKSLRSPIKNK